MTEQFTRLHETVRDTTIVTPIKVSVRRLDTILSKHFPDIKKIDVLAVGVEGWELQVVKGVSLEEYQPKIVILENNFDSSEYQSFMSDRGYRFWCHLAPN